DSISGRVVEGVFVGRYARTGGVPASGAVTGWHQSAIDVGLVPRVFEVLALGQRATLRLDRDATTGQLMSTLKVWGLDRIEHPVDVRTWDGKTLEFDFSYLFGFRFHGDVTGRHVRGWVRLSFFGI